MVGRLIACAVAVWAGLAVTARASGPVDDAALMADPPARVLSAYNLFRDGRAQVPNDRVVPYDLITPLFSDYAHKFRFVHVPAGRSITYTDDGAFRFPVGAVLVKTFAYPADFRRPAENVRLIETRLLIRRANGWKTLPYVWNAAMTEARLKVGGKRVPVTWIDTAGQHRDITYRVPNTNQCKACHILGADISPQVTPIGPKARNLNRDYDYATGRENQLAHWTRLGILTGAPSPDRAPRVARWDDPAAGSLEARARGYLDVNCGHCHNPRGPARTSGLYLTVTEHRPIHWGVMKPPVSAGRGTGGRGHDIVPGKPDRSILTFRMESTDPGVMMPELGRSIVHDEGVALIRKWIAGLDPDDY